MTSRMSRSKLQPPEQLVERQLQHDVKLAELAVIGAHRIEAHFIDDRLDLESIAREKRHAPLRIIEPCRAGDELLHAPRELPADRAVAQHQPPAIFIR